MTEYEMVTLFHPRLDEDGVTEISEWLQQRITELGGENIELHPWGRRSLAYPVRKQTEATYIQFDFNLEGSQMNELTRSMQLNEDILRQLPIRKQDR
jgi:small subunit ribosomal protein S6